MFKVDALNSFLVLAIGFFTALNIIYSFRFMKGRKGLLQYYTCILLTAGASAGVVLANNLIMLAVLWGFLGLTLYLLINFAGEEAVAAAKKTFIILGGTDALMLLGIAIIYHQSGTFTMDNMRISLSGVNASMGLAAYLCIVIACFAKAGAMPFHTWIPDCSEKAPVPVAAYVVASLDKLLGIYLLTRVSLDIFMIGKGINIFLMVTGAFTILAGVMMALVQHNLKRLLGYHSVSQVGYMVLGIGAGTPLGIAGGLFHMLNNSIYKQALFFGAGNIQQKAGTDDLDKLGGLSRRMPFTYISMLIASLAISGVPPFNGFVSKWMIYQGLVQKTGADAEGIIALLCLAAAMFGSGLTLASFIKVLHACFLGQGRGPRLSVSEAGWMMWFPPFLLGGVCLLFGIFAFQVPLGYFILPAIKGVEWTGSWHAELSTLLVLIGLAAGVMIFKLKQGWFGIREDARFVGGEELEPDENRVTGTEFYNTVKEYGFLEGLYSRAERGFFDIYDQGRNFVFGAGRFFQYLHNGVLPTYLVWTLLGMIGLFFVLLK